MSTVVDIILVIREGEGSFAFDKSTIVDITLVIRELSLKTFTQNTDSNFNIID